MPLPCEVAAYLQWAKLARSWRPEGVAWVAKKVLFINMDETSMKLNHGRGKGLLVSKRSLPPGKVRGKEVMSQSDGKACVSFLAFLTHDSSIQPLLPQIVLGNEKLLTLALVASLLPLKPSSFHVWRQKSGWNSHATMVKVLTLLRKCLKPVLWTHDVVLVLDVHRSHFDTSISSLASRYGIKLLYVPGKLTGWLQPADIACFWKLKSWLKRRWLELRSESPDGTVSHKDWLAAFFEVARQVLCGTRWQPAFKAVGLLDERCLSVRVLKQVGWETTPPIPSEPLSVDQLKAIFPKRAVVSRPSLFSWCLPKAKAKGKAKAKAKAMAGGVGHVPMLD